MKNIFARYRHHCKGRFDHQSDWLRLASLGILVITCGALELADNLVPTPIPDHFGGGSAIFSGAMVFLIIQKISRTRFYVDWTLNAIFCMAVGFVLHVDEALDHIYSLVLFCAFLFASGLSRICIGYAAEPQAAASWMLRSGCIALLAALWIIGARVLQKLTMPSNILALDILFQGISIVGFGLSLKEAG
jgi:uncharacterized membrane protein HdeD (DUF308 family)